MLTQSLCSPDSTMTTGEPLDARVAMRSYILMRDGTCSQHGRTQDLDDTIVSAYVHGASTRDIGQITETLMGAQLLGDSEPGRARFPPEEDGHQARLKASGTDSTLCSISGAL